MDPLLCCHHVLSKGYGRFRDTPEVLTTPGDHIRAVRLDRKALQKDVADCIGVSVETILHWELHQIDIAIAHYPKIMNYLGYYPIAEESGTPSLGVLVRRHRIHRGLSLRQAVNIIGVDPGALRTWERGATKPLAHSRAKLIRFIGRWRRFRISTCSPIECSLYTQKQDYSFHWAALGLSEYDL